MTLATGAPLGANLPEGQAAWPDWVAYRRRQDVDLLLKDVRDEPQMSVATLLDRLWMKGFEAGIQCAREEATRGYLATQETTPPPGTTGPRHD